MNNTELLHTIQETIQAALVDGTQIEGAALVAYLSHLETSIETDPAGVDQFMLQRLKADQDLFLENLRHNRASDLEMFRSVIAAGQAAIKAAMSINGAAATAILAFSAHQLTKGGPPGVVASMAVPMVLFVGGVLASTCAYGANYVTQWAYRRHRKGIGNTTNLISIGLVLASHVVFGIAAWWLYSIFRAL